jgi:site-specific recombinase XerD
MLRPHLKKTTSRLIDGFCSDLLHEGISSITVRNYRCDLEAIANWFGARGRNNFLSCRILGTDIVLYKLEISKKFKPSTVNRKLASIRRWIRWRGDSSNVLKRAEPVPIEKRPESPSKSRCLSRNEEWRLLQSARKNGNPFHLAALLLMLRMGLRPSELCSLCWGSIDLVNGSIALGHKTGDVREIPLDSACSAALSSIARRQVSHRDNVVFSQSERPFTRRILERMLEKYSREAKVPNLTLHDFRHTFASRLAQAGASPFELAAFLGHRRLDVMKHYFTHPDEPGRAPSRNWVLSKRVKTDFSA